MSQIPSTADPRQGLRNAYRQYMAQRPATAGAAAAPQEDPRRAQLREAYRQYQAQKAAPAGPIAAAEQDPEETGILADVKRAIPVWALTAARLSNPATMPGAVGDLAGRFASGAFSGVLQQGGQAARLGQALTILPRVFNQGVGTAGAAVAGGVSELADNPAGILNGGFTRGAARGLEAVQGSMPQAGPIESTLRAGAGQVAAPLEAASAAAEGIQTPPKQYTPEWFADMAGRSTPVMVASIAGEMAAGPVGAMLPVFATEGGQVASDIFHDRISQGASEEQALEDAAVPAVITGLFNAGVEMAGVQHLVHAGIVRGEARKWAKEWLASTVSEGLEEVVQNEAQAQTRQAVTGVGPGGTFMDRAVPSFVGGAGLGAAMGGPVALGGVASEGKGLRPAAGPPAPGEPSVDPTAPSGAPAAAPTAETPPAPGTPAAPPASVNAAIDALNAQVAAAKAANAERARAAQADQDALARIQQALVTPAAEVPQTQSAKLEGAMARRRAAPPISIDQDAENQDILDEAIGGVRRGIQDRTTRQETADAEVQQAAPGRGSERGQPGQAEGQGLPAQEGGQGLEQEGQGGPDRALHGQPGPAVEAPPAAPLGVEEDTVPLEKIVNPINPESSDGQKLAQLSALTEHNWPIIQDIIKEIDGTLGTKSDADRKKPGSIMAKAVRPSIRAEKPWHNIEHVRDTLRFQTTLTDPRVLPKVFDILRKRGLGMVKVDTAKMLKPKALGWRFAAFDMRMPNGQLVEYYLPLQELQEVKHQNHLLFEEWRGKTPAEIEARQDEYLAAVKQSYDRYDAAFGRALARLGLSREEFAALWTQIETSLGSSTRSKESRISTIEGGLPKVQAEPDQSALGAPSKSELGTQTRPVSESLKITDGAVSGTPDTTPAAPPKENDRGVLDQGQAPGGVPAGEGQVEKGDGARAPTGPESSAPTGEPAPADGPLELIGSEPMSGAPSARFGEGRGVVRVDDYKWKVGEEAGKMHVFVHADGSITLNIHNDRIKGAGGSREQLAELGNTVGTQAVRAAVAQLRSIYPGATILGERTGSTGGKMQRPVVLPDRKKSGVSSKQENADAPGTGKRAEPGPGVDGKKALGEAPPAADGKAEGGGDVRADDQRPGSAGGKVSEPDRPAAGDRPDGGEEHGPPGVDLRQPAGPRRAPGINYRITPDDRIGVGGFSPKGRYRANVAAIKLLKELEAAGRKATPEEQKVLVQYVGWGGLPQVFGEVPAAYEEGDAPAGADETKPGEWDAEARELKKLLTDDEWKAARASTPNAHFTSAEVITGMWDGLKALGFQGGRIVEPAVGAGHFFGLMPQDIAANSDLRAVERDSLSARITAQLYQQADVKHASFQDVRTPDNSADLYISNVPFANVAVYDKYDRALTAKRLSLHNYFFAKAMKAVRPGGLVAFITTHYTLDTLNSNFRRDLAAQANLVGAVRLPYTAFKGIANTSVVTDIIILQKRGPGIDKAGPDFVRTEPVELKGNDGSVHPHNVNEYFLERKDKIVGRQAATGTMRAKFGYNVEPKTTVKLGPAIAEAIASMTDVNKAALAWTPEQTIRQEKASIDAAGSLTPDGGLALQDGKVYIRRGDELELIPTPGNAKTAFAKHVAAFIPLRDAIRELRAAEKNPDIPDEHLDRLRAALNERYDEFVSKLGPVNRKASWYAEDNDSPLVMALEVYDQEKDTAKKADVFRQRVIWPAKVIDKADSPEAAVRASLDQYGHLDLEHIANLLGITPDKAREALGTRVFENPDGGLELSEFYLSGDVVDKLNAARAAAAENPRFKVNVTALEAVQPKPIPAEQIGVSPGVNWIPADVYQDFLAQQLKIGGHVRYSPELNKWVIGTVKGRAKTLENESVHGTPDFFGHELFEAAMNNSVKTVRFSEAEGGEVNPQATAAARIKQQDLVDRFRTWLWEDGERTARIEGIYNDRFNRTVAPVFDGSHLTLPGSFLPDGRQLHAHVKDAIWRIVSTGNTLLAHAVGAGKTWAMVGAAMEMRRLGIAKKPIIVAPNHVYAQFAREWLQLYPGAKLLVAQTDDFTPAKRRTLMARISTGDWDGVVVPMTSFEKLALSPPLVMEFVQKQINELEEAIRQEKAGKDNGRSLVKELEKAKDRLAGKLAELQAEWKKDPGPYFDDLGIDAMFVDEAHNYKNLWFASRMGRVPGVVPGDAQRAFDMYVKSQYLTRRTGGRSVVLATGTPISNSVTEMFTMIRFLAEQALERRGIQKFDQWAHTFGELVSDVEVTPEGGGLRENSRFVKFKNMPELSQIFRQFADVILPEDLKVKRPAINTGGAQGVQIQPAPGLDAFVQGLVARAARIRSGAVDPSEDNMLKITGEGKKAALDMRLVDPDAPDLPNSKLATCAAKVHDIWEKTKATKGTQIVWCDLGTPTGKRGKGGAPAILNDQMSAEERMAALEEAASQGSLNVYEDLTKKLVAKGIPRTQIAWIHDAKDEAAKARMFERFRLGQLRVILASTQKMGTGANVQDRIVAMHHLDAPWRPADIEQRDGRGYRQGNTNASIDIFRYIAKDSFDAYLWQLLEIKSKFIHAAMKGEGGMREIGGDIGSQALEYSELKALAAKDPRIVEVTRLQNQVQKLAALEASHAAQLGRLKQTISRLPAKIEWSEKSLAARRAAVKLLEPLAEAFSKAKAGEMPPLTMMGKTYTDREEAKAALTNAAVGDAVFEKPESFEDAGTTSVRKVGAMGPISIIGKLNKKYGLGLVLEAAGVRVSTNNLDADGAHNLRLILDAVRSLYKGEMIPHDEASIKADADELGKARERLEQIKVFPRAAEYAEKRAKLAELRRELDVNNRPDDKVPGAEDVPSLPPLKRRSEVEKRAFTLLEDVTGRPVGEYTVHPLFLREAKKGEVQRPLPHDQQRKLIDNATAAVRKATGNAQVEWSDDEGRFQYPEVRRVGYKQITEWRPVPQKTWHPIVKDIADDAKGVEAVVEGIPYWGYHMPAGAPVEAEHVAAAMEQAQQQITSEAQAKRTGKLFLQPDLVARLEAKGREHLAMAREAMSGGAPAGAYSTPGARSGHAVNIFDAALHLATAAAYQAAAKAVKGGAALTRIVRETIAEFTGGHIAVSQVDVRRMATAILKEATSAGKFNQAAFDQAVDDMRLAGTGHATTHPGKVAKAVYERARKDASQEARQELEDLTEKSRRMAVMERYERRAAVQGAKLEAKDNAQQVKAYQERAVYWANRLLPTKERGKVLAAVVAARNPARLYGAMNRMTRVLARHEAREMWRSVLKLTKPKLTRKLTIPRLEVANTIKLEAALAWAGVKQKGLTNHQVSELALELRRHAENLATLYHEQRDERKAWGAAFVTKVATIREAVIERIERKKEIRSRGPIASGVRTATGLPRRVYDRSLNIDVISQALDHDWDRAGPMAGTVRALEDAEWDYLALRKKLADLAEGIFKKHGYKSTADFEAKTAGTLGFNAVKTLDIRLGGYSKMPMGVALSLAAADPRARAYWTSQKKGVLGSWRFDPTNRAFPVPASVLDAVDQDPDVAKHEAMIEDFKGLFGKLFREAHPVVLRLTGKAAPPVGDAYWPMPRNQELRAGDDVPPGIREMRHHLEDAGFMKPRSGGSSPLIIDDFSTTVNRHLDSIARIIAMSEAVRLASGVWLSPDVKQELTARYGSQMVDDLRMVLDEFVGSGPRVHKGAGALLVGISRNVTAAMTQLNKNTMARQLFGVFRLIPEMGLERWAKGMAGMFGKGVGDQIRHSPWFWARYSTAPYHQFSSIDGDVSEASGGQSWRALQALGAESVRKLAGKQADVSRPWAAFRDSIRVGNVFDAIPARVAWAGYAGHPQQAKMATRAFRRTQNTTGALDSGMWMVEGRSSPALGMWLSLTSDANKQFNVLNRYTRRVMADPSASNVRDLAYAVTGMSLNVIGGAAIRLWWTPALWLLGAALGGHNDRDKRRRDAQAAAWTAAQEAAGAIIPGSGRVLEIAQGVTAPWQQGGGTDTPFGSNLSQAVNGLQGMARDIIAHPHRFQRDPAFWLSASRLVKALGSAAGAPTPIISELEQFLRGFNGHK